MSSFLEAQLGSGLATLVSLELAQATTVAAAAGLTSIDLDPAAGTADAEGDLGDVTDAAQDINNATIAAQFNALRVDVAELRTQFNALLAALKTGKFVAVA
jgi:hypothetical protein